MASSIYGKPETPLLRGGSSACYLTFDEFQNALGERGASLGSMNMEELLKNIWTAEESQAMAVAMDSAESLNGGFNPQPSLQKQASLSLPRTLSGRMVQDVWKSLQHLQDGVEVSPPCANYYRQFTLGEVTLEELLLRAGLAREQAPSPAAVASPVLPNQVLKSQVIPSIKQSIMGSAPSNQANQVLGIQPPGSAKFGHDIVARRQAPAPPNPIKQPANPPLAFGGFAGNPVFSIPTAVEINQTESVAMKNSLFTTSNTSMSSSSPEIPRFDHHNSSASPAQGVDWVNKSPVLSCGGSKSPRLSLTFQGQQAPNCIPQQSLLEPASQFGAFTPTGIGPAIEASAGKMSPLGAVLGSVVGNGAPGLGLGANSSSTRISFGAGLPLSPAFDEEGAGISNFPISMIPEFGNGFPPRRKRLAEAPLDRVIERRQRRMIKNRESAARSRARKLAYTVELEAEVSQLKEENTRLLQKQEEEVARRKSQILAFMPARPPGTGYKVRSLKRTHTLPW